MRNKRGSHTKIFLMVFGVVAALVFCIVIVVKQLDRTMLLRSDYSGIEYEIEDDQIICISVKSKFPYSRVLCPHETESIQDADGNIIEIIDTYTMAANLSLLGRNAVSMKLDIETSDDVAYIYILKFADGDIKIINGKVVEAP